MPDTRTRRQKLEAMAAQSVSPHEAEVARRKLASMRKDEPRPTRRWAFEPGPTPPPPDNSWAYMTTSWEDILGMFQRQNADDNFVRAQKRRAEELRKAGLWIPHDDREASSTFAAEAVASFRKRGS